LQPLSTLTRPNEVVTIDFIVKLPKSKDPITDISYDSALVSVDRLTKFAKFAPWNENWSAEKLAHTVLRYIVADNDLPDVFVTDRDKLFISKFWQTFMSELGVDQRMSTAYHPQTDGQTERVNQILEVYLRIFINRQQDDWVRLLPLAQIAYNGTFQETIGMSPYKARFGYDLIVDRLPKNQTEKSQRGILQAEEFKTLHRQLTLDIEFVNTRMKWYTDRSQS
jgi:transposase InsO family protein